MPRLSFPEDRAKRKEQWLQLNRTILHHEGWIVSAEDAFPIRFECKPDNPLPEILRSAGYQIDHRGTEDRFLPVPQEVHEHGRRETVTRDVVKPVAVEIFHLRLPAQ
jgi:hypothetical protein